MPTLEIELTTTSLIERIAASFNKDEMYDLIVGIDEAVQELYFTECLAKKFTGIVEHEAMMDLEEFRKIPATNFMQTLEANVINDTMADISFREFVRNSIDSVIFKSNIP